MRLKTAATMFLVALTVAVLVVGCSSAKKDEALATDIQAKMFADPQVKTANISVAVKNGEVTLSGTAPDDGARYQAFKIAMDTPGVKHVTDQTTLQTAQAAAVAAPAAPAPVEQPTPKPERKSAKHHAKSDSKLEAATPGQPPAPEPAAAPVAPAPQQEAAAPAPPPQPKHVEIPAGTSVRVQMIDGVNSAVNHTGDMFHASLAAPIVIDDQVVVPTGTDMYVKLTNAKSAGRMTGQSELALELVRMDFQGKTYTLTSNDYQQTGSSRGKRTAETVGGGAVIGALIGAAIGHGKGAAIGAATGAGAGTVAEGVTKGQQIQIASETKVDFALQAPVDVSYFPEKNRSTRH